jgi:hypothetical protein
MGVGDQGYAPVAVPPGKRHGTNFTRGLLGLRVSLESCGKSSFHRVSILRLFKLRSCYISKL